MADGIVIHRYILETMFPGEYISYAVIDTWATILNNFENERNLNNSP